MNKHVFFLFFVFLNKKYVSTSIGLKYLFIPIILIFFYYIIYKPNGIIKRPEIGDYRMSLCLYKFGIYIFMPKRVACDNHYEGIIH